MLVKGLLLYSKVSFGIGFYLYSFDALLLATIALIMCRLSCVKFLQDKYIDQAKAGRIT